MQQIKSDSEILAEIYRNAQLAITSISDILPEVEEDDIREELKRQHEEYERVCSQAATLAKNYDLELKDPSPVKKAMMWSAIKMNTVADNSASHIAALMIRGTVNGITALKSSLSDGEHDMQEDVRKLLHDLINLEESFEEKLKAYL